MRRGRHNCTRSSDRHHSVGGSLAFAATPGVHSALAALGALLALEPTPDFTGHGRADVAAVLAELEARKK